MRRRCQRSRVSGVTSQARASTPGERRCVRVEQGPVLVGEIWSVDLAVQHVELVAQHDDLEVFERPGRTARRASDASSRYKMRYTKLQDRPAFAQFNDHDRVSNTHTLRVVWSRMVSSRHDQVLGTHRECLHVIRNANVYAICMAQLVARVDDDLAAAVDQLVEAGVFASRSEAVRLGLERLVDRCRRDEIGMRIARGYRECPQSEAEVAWVDESSVRMIAEEPW